MIFSSGHETRDMHFSCHLHCHRIQDVRHANTLCLFVHPTVDYGTTRHHGLQSSPRHFIGPFSCPFPSLVFKAYAQTGVLWFVYQVACQLVSVCLHFHVNGYFIGRFTPNDMAAACDTIKRKSCGAPWGKSRRILATSKHGFDAIWISPVTANLEDATSQGKL